MYILNRIPAIGKLIGSNIAIDTETALTPTAVAAGIKLKGSTPYHQALQIITIYSPECGSYLLEWRKLRDNPKARLALGAILDDPRIEKRFHNAVFDLHFLINDGGYRVRNVVCSMVAAQALFGGDYG